MDLIQIGLIWLFYLNTAFQLVSSIQSHCDLSFETPPPIAVVRLGLTLDSSSVDCHTCSFELKFCVSTEYECDEKNMKTVVLYPDREAFVEFPIKALENVFFNGKLVWNNQLIASYSNEPFGPNKDHTQTFLAESLESSATLYAKSSFKCSINYYGPLCERCCISVPNVNSCDENGIIVCSLGKVFVGNSCVDDHCARNAVMCQNDGVCKNRKENFVCLCQAGFTDSICSTWDPCSVNPCRHNGRCQANLSSKTMTCECTKNYHGSRCENYVAPPLDDTTPVAPVIMTTSPPVKSHVTQSGGKRPTRNRPIDGVNADSSSNDGEKVQPEETFNTAIFQITMSTSVIIGVFSGLFVVLIAVTCYVFKFRHSRSHEVELQNVTRHDLYGSVYTPQSAIPPLGEVVPTYKRCLSIDHDGLMYVSGTSRCPSEAYYGPISGGGGTCSLMGGSINGTLENPHSHQGYRHTSTLNHLVPPAPPPYLHDNSSNHEECIV